jgi:DNA-directed RNA polymerase specialized sigma24 family protein
VERSKGEQLMCSDNGGLPLSFSELVIFLQQPPFEPCDRELDFLDPNEYDKSFTEIVNRYSRPITGVIVRITQDPASASELAQDVFINLYKARISFAPSYIYRAAKNAAYSELRRRKRESNALYAHSRGIKLDKKSKDFDPPDTQP